MTPLKQIRRISTAISTVLLLASGSGANAGGTDTYLFINSSGVPLFYWVFDNGWNVGSDADTTVLAGVRHMYYLPRCSFTNVKHENWQNSGFPPTVKISLAVPTGRVQIGRSSSSEQSSEFAVSGDVKANIEGVGKSAEASAQASYKNDNSYQSDATMQFSIGGQVTPSPFLFDPKTATWDPHNRTLKDTNGTDFSYVGDDGYSMYYMAPAAVPGFESHTCGTLGLAGSGGARFSWNSNFREPYLNGK